jgi:hypothetical protein
MNHFNSKHFSSKNRQGRSFAALAILAAVMSGCAAMPDGVSSAFVDPAKYNLYDCTQLRTAREANAKRLADVQGLMAKAETGAAGSVVAEVAYGNDLIAARAQSHLADEVWQRNRCDNEPAPVAKPDPVSTIKDMSAGAKRNAR